MNEQSDDEIPKESSGRVPGMGIFVPLEFGCIFFLSMWMHFLTNLEALQTLSFWVFIYGGFIT